MQQCAREQPSDGLHEAFDEVVIALATDPRLTAADVQLLVEQGLVVRADIEHHRDDPSRVDAAGGGVDGELADGDLDSSDTPVADAQDAFGVGHHHQVDLVGREAVVPQRDLDVLRGVDGQVDTARTSVLVAEAADRLADRGRVDDRQHLLQVVCKQPEEQHLVAVPEQLEIDVLGQVRGLRLVLGVHPLELVLDRRHSPRQQPGQPQGGALLVRERGAAVDRPRGKHRTAAGRHLEHTSSLLRHDRHLQLRASAAARRDRV